MKTHHHCPQEVELIFCRILNVYHTYKQNEKNWIGKIALIQLQFLYFNILNISKTYHAALFIQVYVTFWWASWLRRRRKDICTSPTESYVIYNVWDASLTTTHYNFFKQVDILTEKTFTLNPPLKLEYHPFPLFLQGMFGILLAWTSGNTHVSPPPSISQCTLTASSDIPRFGSIQ